MKNIGEFSADGYGMSIISTDLFTEYLKNKRCRAKKILSYFDKNKELFFDSIRAGRFLPFYKIPSFQYSIFLSIDEQATELPVDYDVVFRYNNFYLEVGGLGKACIARLNYLEYQFEDIKQNLVEKENIIPSGPEGVLEKYYPVKGFEIRQGIYEFDLIGLERKERIERESKNYAYAFVFRKNENAKNDNLEKADNDNFDFSPISKP